jgi:hypothetical protein
METIIIDEKGMSYTLYVAKTKACKPVMVAAYVTHQFGKRCSASQRIFSSVKQKLWRELRSMI